MVGFHCRDYGFAAPRQRKPARSRAQTRAGGPRQRPQRGSSRQRRPETDCKPPLWAGSRIKRQAASPLTASCQSLDPAPTVAPSLRLSVPAFPTIAGNAPRYGRWRGRDLWQGSRLCSSRVLATALRSETRRGRVFGGVSPNPVKDCAPRACAGLAREARAFGVPDRISPFFGRESEARAVRVPPGMFKEGDK